MSDKATRMLLVAMTYGIFAIIMLAVLLGLVSVDNTEISKLVGAIFGYFTGLITSIFSKYFNHRETE